VLYQRKNQVCSDEQSEMKLGVPWWAGKSVKTVLRITCDIFLSVCPSVTYPSLTQNRNDVTSSRFEGRLPSYTTEWWCNFQIERSKVKDMATKMQKLFFEHISAKGWSIYVKSRPKRSVHKKPWTTVILTHESQPDQCQGVSITQRNNSAVLGFAQANSGGWGKT